jgi:hypothetical protein
MMNKIIFSIDGIIDTITCTWEYFFYNYVYAEHDAHYNFTLIILTIE